MIEERQGKKWGGGGGGEGGARWKGVLPELKMRTERQKGGGRVAVYIYLFLFSWQKLCSSSCI